MNKHSNKFLTLIHGFGVSCFAEEYGKEEQSASTMEEFCTTNVDIYYSDEEGFTQADRDVLKAARLHYNSPVISNLNREMEAYVDRRLEKLYDEHDAASNTEPTPASPTTEEFNKSWDQYKSVCHQNK